jgi:hypothetical protein
MVQLMVEICPFLSVKMLSVILQEAVRNEDIDILSWAGPGSQLFHHSIRKYNYFPGNLAVFTAKALTSSSEEIFQTWKRGMLKWAGGANVNACIESLGLEEVVTVATGPFRESRMISIWEELASAGVLTYAHVKRALTSVALYSCSLQLTKALLEHGAAVGGRGAGHLMEVALSIASGYTTKRAAQLMQFLLLAGAKGWRTQSDETGGRTIIASNKLGARKISKWLGMSWDELVAWAQEQRSAMQLDGVRDPYSKIIEAFFSSSKRQARGSS